MPALTTDRGGGSLTSYQWFVFIVASLGWLFDTMDQQLFNLARKSAVRDLLGVQAGDARCSRQPSTLMAAYATTIFMIGWALGGFFFGVLGDRDRPRRRRCC